MEVAPFTGAWIETGDPTPSTADVECRPLHGGVDRNLGICYGEGGAKVAPFTGAWIETGGLV